MVYSRSTAAPAPAAAPEPKPDSAEEQEIAQLKAKEAARLEAEITAIRAESTRQLEEKITAARSKSEKELNDSVSYFRARYTEARAGIISTNPQTSGSLRVLRRVDRSQTTERALLLLPDGPLVMQLSITMDGNSNNDPIWVEDFPFAGSGIPPLRRHKYIGERYVETMENRLVAGRTLTWTDVHNDVPAVM